MSEDGIKQATKMMDKLIDYWLDHPEEGLKRGVELFANKNKINLMVMSKALREGIDSDKAMPILDKIIKKIPTIKQTYEKAYIFKQFVVALAWL